MSDADPFDLAAAGLRSDGADLLSAVDVLASKLEQALPAHTSVQRRGEGLLGRGPKHVHALQVQLGDCCYSLAVDGGHLQGSRERQSGGIAIKREPLDPDAWLTALTEDLREEAQRSAEARAALEQLLMR
ncbi:MAG: hypothetical protein ACLQBB_01080 [Solirubrobacteraceae bacterium]